MGTLFRPHFLSQVPHTATVGQRDRLSRHRQQQPSDKIPEDDSEIEFAGAIARQPGSTPAQVAATEASAMSEEWIGLYRVPYKLIYQLEVYGFYCDECLSSVPWGPTPARWARIIRRNSGNCPLPPPQFLDAAHAATARLPVKEEAADNRDSGSIVGDETNRRNGGDDTNSSRRRRGANTVLDEQRTVVTVDYATTEPILCDACHNGFIAVEDIAGTVELMEATIPVLQHCCLWPKEKANHRALLAFEHCTSNGSTR